MRRILIVADRLLGGAELRERLALKKSTDPEIEVFVLVPQRTATAGDGTAKSAEQILELELAVLRDLQYEVDGAVGEADPLAAVRTLLESRPFDEIIVATLPAGGASAVAAHGPRPPPAAGDEAAGGGGGRRGARRRRGGPPGRAPLPGRAGRAGAAGARCRVLLVEDDEDDAELTRLALGRCPTPSMLDTVGDGAQAIEWLRAAGGSTGSTSCSSTSRCRSSTGSSCSSGCAPSTTSSSSPSSC